MLKFYFVDSVWKSHILRQKNVLSFIGSTSGFKFESDFGTNFMSYTHPLQFKLFLENFKCSWKPFWVVEKIRDFWENFEEKNEIFDKMNGF